VKIVVSTMSGKQISNPIAWSLFEIVFMLCSKADTLASQIPQLPLGIW
jgi:hypothetical protein